MLLWKLFSPLKQLRVEKVKEFAVICWTGLVSSLQVQLSLPNARIAPSHEIKY